VIDYYINFVMTLVGFLECFGAGWVYGIEEQIKSVGNKAGKCNAELFKCTFLPNAPFFSNQPFVSPFALILQSTRG
jgi:hypothetical protein